MSFTCSSREATVKLKSRAISSLLQSATGYSSRDLLKTSIPSDWQKNIVICLCVGNTALTRSEKKIVLLKRQPNPKQQQQQQQ